MFSAAANLKPRTDSDGDNLGAGFHAPDRHSGASFFVHGLEWFSGSDQSWIMRTSIVEADGNAKVILLFCRRAVAADAVRDNQLPVVHENGLHMAMNGGDAGPWQVEVDGVDCLLAKGECFVKRADKLKG